MVAALASASVSVNLAAAQDATQPPAEPQEVYQVGVKDTRAEQADKPAGQIEFTGDLALSGANRWVALASMEDLDQAIEFARGYADQKSRVVKTQNGWFAVVLGPYPTSSLSAFRKSYEGPPLPPKPILMRGTSFVETAWPPPAETAAVAPAAQPAPAEQVPAAEAAAIASAETAALAPAEAVPAVQAEAPLPDPIAADAAPLAQSKEPGPVDDLSSYNAGGPLEDAGAAYDSGDYATALKLWKQTEPVAPGETPRDAAEAGQPEKLALADDKRWVAIASLQDLDQAVEFARGYADQKPRVVKTENGWLAVVLGPYETPSVSSFRETYKGPPLPPSIMLTRGTSFVETLWPAPGDVAVMAPVEAAPEATNAAETAPPEVAPEADATAAAATEPVDDLSTEAVGGPLVNADAAAALNVLRPMAEQGEAPAQNELGTAYVSGKGVPQDYVLAHMWFNLAASQGEDTARQNRDAVAKMMTREQIADAQRMAREWKPVSTP